MFWICLLCIQCYMHRSCVGALTVEPIDSCSFILFCCRILCPGSAHLELWSLMQVVFPVNARYLHSVLCVNAPGTLSSLASKPFPLEELTPVVGSKSRGSFGHGGAGTNRTVDGALGRRPTIQSMGTRTAESTVPKPQRC